MHFGKLTPNLMVADVERAVAFYRDRLGFELVMAVPVDSETVVTALDGRVMQYALVARDGVELMFQQRESLLRDVPGIAPTIGASLTLYFNVNGLDEMARRLADLPALKPIAVTFYGMRELYVRDADGYIVCLAEPA